MRFFSILWLFVLICACNKPVYKHNKEFEGTWRTVPVFDQTLNAQVLNEIVIQGEDGTMKISCNPCGEDLCNCLGFQVGKAVMNSDRTQMRIGSSGFALTIQEEPNLDSNGVWTMKLQNLRYYRQ
jgi:hypothetical protein